MHEKKVDLFYSSGLKNNWSEYDYPEPKNERYNSFGFWYRNTRNYIKAAKNLVDFFIHNSGIVNAKKILNVACGYGAESFAYYHKWNSEKIIGIDVTKVHTEYANKKAKILKLDDKLKFYHGDACVLDFPESSFTHVLGIEGPVHFNTRESFFQSAYRVLQKKGELILTDVILGKKFKKIKGIQKVIMNWVARKWQIPKENWVNEQKYCRQLENTGFKVVFMKQIGESVFPGYARNVFRPEALKYCLNMRGLLTTIGFTVISGLLGYLYKRGFIDYVYVKARK